MNNIEENDSDDSYLINKNTKDSDTTDNSNKIENTGPIRFTVDFNKLKNQKSSSETIYNNESFDYFCKKI